MDFLCSLIKIHRYLILISSNSNQIGDGLICVPKDTSPVGLKAAY